MITEKTELYKIFKLNILRVIVYDLLLFRANITKDVKISTFLKSCLLSLFYILWKPRNCQQNHFANWVILWTALKEKVIK